MEKRQVEKEFEELVKKHELLIHKVCGIYAYTTADKQDLFQEIIIQTWKAYPRFNGLSKISTWLYRIAINTAITGLRKRKNNFIVSYENADLPANIADDSTNNTEEEKWQELHRAIEQLNQVEKAIVMLYMEDHSYEDMEEILGINQGSLRVKMSRIKDKLRQLTKNK